MHIYFPISFITTQSQAYLAKCHFKSFSVKLNDPIKLSLPINSQVEASVSICYQDCCTKATFAPGVYKWCATPSAGKCNGNCSSFFTAISIRPNKKQLSTLFSILLAVGYSFVHIAKDFNGIDISANHSPPSPNGTDTLLLQIFPKILFIQQSNYACIKISRCLLTESF